METDCMKRMRKLTRSHTCPTLRARSRTDFPLNTLVLPSYPTLFRDPPDFSFGVGASEIPSGARRASVHFSLNLSTSGVI